jgi:hypothetical protein
MLQIVEHNAFPIYQLQKTACAMPNFLFVTIERIDFNSIYIDYFQIGECVRFLFTSCERSLTKECAVYNLWNFYIVHIKNLFFGSYHCYILYVPSSGKYKLENRSYTI